MTDPRVLVLEQTVAFDGFFKVIRYRLRHRQFAGGMGAELVREVLERGHAVVVLPFDPMRDQVVLIEQFRIGALGVVADPWLVEPVAGIIEPGETAPEVARREALEEAGLELMDLVPACSYFASPEANVGGFGVGSDLTWKTFRPSSATARLCSGRTPRSPSATARCIRITTTRTSSGT
jgi:nudix-type nucleoside diphosphatase (YffH/AdpP family)